MHYECAPHGNAEGVVMLLGVSPDQEERVCDALVDLGWLENDHALHTEAVIAIGPSWGARLMRRDRFLTSCEPASSLM